MMQFLPGDLAQLQVDDEANRRRQAQAQALQQAGFNPVQGGNPLLSLLTSFASTFAGNKLMKDSDTKASELLAKQFELENQQSQAKMEAEQRRRDEDYQRELEKLTKAEEAKAKFRAPRNIDPLSPEGIAASLGLEQAKIGMQPRGGGNPTEKGWEVMDTPQGMVRVNKLTGAVEPLRIGDDPLMGKAGSKPMDAQSGLALENSLSNLDRLKEAATEVYHGNVGGITGIQGAFPNAPGGAAANTQADLEALKSQVGFGVLQAMRDASKTGGALGNVSEREIELLQNNLAALDTKQSPEEFKKELKKIISYAEGVKQRQIAAYESENGPYKRQGAAPQSQGGWSIQRLD